MSNDQTSKLHTARDWHVYMVYNDPDFIYDYEIMKKSGLSDWYSILALEYSIEPYDVFYYEMSHILSLGNNVKSKANRTFDPINKKHSIEFDYDASEAEIVEVWKKFDKTRTAMVGFSVARSGKRKPPENPKLIYAIFKALKKHTFEEVFDMYKKAKLDNYIGARKSYDTANELRKFYNHHKPKQTR